MKKFWKWVKYLLIEERRTPRPFKKVEATLVDGNEFHFLEDKNIRTPVIIPMERETTVTGRASSGGVRVETDKNGNVKYNHVPERRSYVPTRSNWNHSNPMPDGYIPQEDPFVDPTHPLSPINPFGPFSIFDRGDDSPSQNIEYHSHQDHSSDHSHNSHSDHSSSSHNNDSGSYGSDSTSTDSTSYDSPSFD